MSKSNKEIWQIVEQFFADNDGTEGGKENNLLVFKEVKGALLSEIWDLLEVSGVET